MRSISKLGDLKIYKSYKFLATSYKLVFSGHLLEACSLKLVAIDFDSSLNHLAKNK